MLTSGPANDNAQKDGAASAGGICCDSHLMVALLNTRAALEALLPHAGTAPLKDQSYAIGAIQQADNVIDRMGVTHAR